MRQSSENYFAKSSHLEQIILHRGNALDIIPQLKQKWDLVFIDADKTNYINYYELTLPRLKKGGLFWQIMCCFMEKCWKKRLPGKNAKAINNFNEHVAKDKRVQQVIMTVRDGLMMIMKK